MPMTSLPHPRASSLISPVCFTMQESTLYLSPPKVSSSVEAPNMKPLSETKGLSYKTCIATVCFEGTVWEKIDATASAGFDSIEIMTTDLDEATPEKILSYCKSKHLSVSILQPFRDLEGHESTLDFNRKLSEFERFLKDCVALEADTILLCANCDQKAVCDNEIVLSQLRQAASVAAKYGVRIAYENLSWATHNSHLERLVEIIELVNMENFGVCLDLFHINIHESSLSCLERLRKKVFFVQLCDSPALSESMDILKHARTFRCFPFQGEYHNILDLLEQLEKLDYNGPLSLEVFNESYKNSPGQCIVVAEDAMRSLIYSQLRFSDVFKGTCCLPGALVSGVEFPQIFTDWSSVKLAFNSRIDRGSFERRVTLLEYNEIKVADISSSVCLSKSSVVRVSSRLVFNRLTLALRIALGFEPQVNHSLTIRNEFNLPFQSVFCNENGVILIVSLLVNI